MANKLQKTPTEADAHAVATMLAMRLPMNAIALRTGLSVYGIRKLEQRADWSTLVAAKRQALQTLMAGTL